MAAKLSTVSECSAAGIAVINHTLRDGIVTNETGNHTSLRQLVLTRAEALVLSDWLNRFESSESASCDSAELAVLARIGAQLDEQLEELFAPNYNELVAKAKESLTSSASR